MNWKDQIAVVTGATSGIGRAIALTFAERGMTVGLIGRHPARMEATAQVVRATGARALTYCADLSHDEEINRLKAAIQRDCGAIDILVHAAGIFFMGSIEHAPLAEFDQLFRVNLRAPYALTQALLPMISPRRGQIVFVNSSVGLVTRTHVGAYAATKYGLRAIADTLRQEVNSKGVRVLSLFPGRTATPQQENVHTLEGKQYQPDLLMQPEDVASAIADALAISRTAEITDVSMRPMQKNAAGGEKEIV
jgi:short-subunit dehydrogenase